MLGVGVFVCVHVVCECAGVLANVCTCGGQVCQVSSLLSSSILFEAESLPEVRSSLSLARLTGYEVPGAVMLSHLSRARFTDRRGHARFFHMGTEDPNSDPYACPVSNSPSDPSAQPPVICRSHCYAVITIITFVVII